MNEKITKDVSKFLSLILRHSPEKIGLKLDENGWADVDELIEKCNKNCLVFIFFDFHFNHLSCII